MIHSGANLIDGVPVEVIRKRIRCINIRVRADGGVVLSIPKWWATLRQGEAFLREKWKWITKARAEVLSRPAAMRAPVTDDEIESLRPVLDELTDLWAVRLHADVDAANALADDFDRNTVNQVDAAVNHIPH